MPTITLELTDEALVLLADRARRRGRPTGLYATQLMQQSLLLGDGDGGDTLSDLVSLTAGFSSLSGNVAALIEHQSDPSLVEPLEIIRKQVDWVSAVMQSALPVLADRRRLQSLFDSVPRLVQEFELRPVLQHVMTVSQTYKKETHRLECVVDSAVPTVIDGDQNKLEQVLYNLMTLLANCSAIWGREPDCSPL